MSLKYTDALIPFEPGQAVGRGWTEATGSRPVGVTWHWTATRDLAQCRRTIGGATAERRGEASAHYGIGRTFEEGVDRYVLIENRSWHAGINQTLQWDGKPLLDNRFKASRTTIGVETVNVGFERDGFPAASDWIAAADATGKHVMRVQPWPQEQIAMMVDIGQQIVGRWSGIKVRDHHGHHDICPGYKQDVAGFPFARVLRGIYPDSTIPDVWTPLWLPGQRQSALLALGYDVGSAAPDNDWGRFSDAALRRFQREHGMLADGMWTTFVNWKVYDAMAAKGIRDFFRDSSAGEERKERAVATEVRTRAELDAALANDGQVILLIMGDGTGFPEIRDEANDAVQFGEIQKVVWLRDESILTPEERAEYQPGDPNYIACALSRPPRHGCAYVARGRALMTVFMQAIDAAWQGTQPPKKFE